MRLTFLGTGTSFGVPVVGCRCETCLSDDPRDRRTRHGALLDLPDGRLLVDAPPELRLQLLREGVDRVDALWLTHLHADHVHGLDDVRVFTVRGRAPLPAWVPRVHADELAARFPYIFDPTPPPAGTSKPQLEVHRFDGGDRLEILGARLTALALPHGPTEVYGFRAGALGYVTDAKRLTTEALEVLDGVEVLVLNALWWGRPHPTHFNVEEAVETAHRVGARQTWLVHLTHRVRHADLEARLPRDVRPAHDGLTLEIP